MQQKNKSKEITQTGYPCTLLPAFAEHYLMFQDCFIVSDCFCQTIGLFRRSKSGFSLASKLNLTMSLLKLKILLLA